VTERPSWQAETMTSSAAPATLAKERHEKANVIASKLLRCTHAGRSRDVRKWPARCMPGTRNGATAERRNGEGTRRRRNATAKERDGEGTRRRKSATCAKERRSAGARAPVALLRRCAPSPLRSFAAALLRRCAPSPLRSFAAALFRRCALSPPRSFAAAPLRPSAFRVSWPALIAQVVLSSLAAPGLHLVSGLAVVGEMRVRQHARARFSFTA
jgi:hypothetical protein